MTTASSSLSSSSHISSSSWRIDFLNSLTQRDKREKSHDAFISAYSRLASRTASIHESSASFKDASNALGEGVPEGGDLSGAAAGLIQLRADLTAAQQTKAHLQLSLKAVSEEKDTLQRKLEQQDRIILERNRLDRRTRDLEEEVRAKNKHIQELQDEILTLTMELNMLTKREEAVRKENKELVDRYMAEMAKKAESMNRASNWE
ncbi:autophagy-related protein 16 [Morchella snyderi]|nr:autophagy-related protein 16 [Morchella snyderi]